MKNADRQKIFDKYGGRCAYCGCDLVKGWHVDEIELVKRKRRYIKERCYGLVKETGIEVKFYFETI